MALRFDGVDDFLEHAAVIRSSTGYSMAIMVASDKSGASSEQACIAQGSTTNDAFMTVGFNGSSENKYSTDRGDGVGSNTSTKTTSPNIAGGSFGWLFGLFTSNTSRAVAFGSSATSTPDTASSGQNYSHLNRCLIGAARRSAGLLHYAKADLAEAHWFSTVLTSAEMADLVAGTVLPEAIPSWIDGWTLATFQAGGTYTSIGGSRTMTASGGVIVSPLSHPITRSGGSTPVAFTGTIPTLNGSVGASFAAQSPTIASYYSGTLTPFAYSLFSGALPAGLTLNSSTGVISGTPTTAGTTTGLVVRATDSSSNTANSNSFSIVVAAAAATSMTIALKQSDGTTPAASITGIEYAVLGASTLAAGAAAGVLASGTGESADGSGNLVLNITGLGLSPGNVRYVIAGKSNGTVGANFDGWHGPAVAA